MINVTRVGDFTFELRFDERLRSDLEDISGWVSTELAIERILANSIIGWRHFSDFDDDVPF